MADFVAANAARAFREILGDGPHRALRGAEATGLSERTVRYLLAARRWSSRNESRVIAAFGQRFINLWFPTPPAQVRFDRIESLLTEVYMQQQELRRQLTENAGGNANIAKRPKKISKTRDIMLDRSLRSAGAFGLVFLTALAEFGQTY